MKHKRLSTVALRLACLAACLVAIELAVLSSTLPAAEAVKVPDGPNIVVILADDLG